MVVKTNNNLKNKKISKFKRGLDWWLGLGFVLVAGYVGFMVTSFVIWFVYVPYVKFGFFVCYVVKGGTVAYVVGIIIAAVDIFFGNTEKLEQAERAEWLKEAERRRKCGPGRGSRVFLFG